MAIFTYLVLEDTFDFLFVCVSNEMSLACIGDFFFNSWFLTPLSAIFQLYHGDQF